MSRISSATNILMEMRKLFQHPYLVAPEMDNAELSEAEQHKQLIDASGKLLFLKQLLPRLKERGRRVLLFSQFKIALDLIEDFIRGEGYKYLRLDGDVNQLYRQKDMDMFNAPGSEYFIFLLTTRAGGVGINLASADTVIVHDPDFNPHQDLQAISRAHRYGQTKRVLVFKLMMENSAEVRIINSGKKKLVLDHLVVQQLGKDREEGEYENLILYGAEDITKIDEDASSMRVWTPKMINGLIDDAEKEAEEMAKAQEAAEAAKAASQADDETSKTHSFSFAKIWETEAKEVAVADSDEPEAEPEFDEHGWVQFLQQAETTEAAQREAARAVAGRLRALKKKVKYTLESADFGDTTPEKRKNKKGKAKELSQAMVNDRDEDDSFVPGPDFNLISDDEDIPAPEGPSDLEDLSNEQRTIFGGLAAGKRKLTRHERELLRRWHSLDEKKRAEALAAATASNSSAPQAQPGDALSSGPPSAAAPGLGEASQNISAPQASAASWPVVGAQPGPGPGPATTAQRLVPLAGSSQQSHLGAVATAGEAIQRAANGEVPKVNGPPPLAHRPPMSDVKWPSMPMVTGPKHSINVAAGRAVIQDLYRALQTTDNPVGHSADWGELVRLTTPVPIRKGYYVYLGKIADGLLETGQQHNARRFSDMGGPLVAAFYFIDSGEPIYPQVQRTQPPSYQAQPHAPLDHGHHVQVVHTHAGQPGVPQPGVPQLHRGPIPPRPFAYQPASQQPHFQHGSWAAVGNGSVHLPPQPMPQQVRPPMPQPILQQVRQPFQHPIQQPVPQRVPQPVPEIVPQPAPHIVGQPMAPAMSQFSATAQPQKQIPPQPLPSASHRSLPLTQSHQTSATTPHRVSAPHRQPPSGVAGTGFPVRMSQLPSSPAASRLASIVPSVPPNSGEPQPPSPLDSRPSDASPGKVIPLSSSSLKATGAQPVVASAMQLGDSSRFDPRSHGDQSEKAKELCYWCQQHHKLRDCPGLLSWEDIEMYRQGIETSDDTAAAKASGLEALSIMEAARKERDDINSRNRRKRPHGSASDAAGDPVEIDLDSRPPSRPDTAAASKRVRTAATFQGCQVCGDELPHTLAACPIVLASADSIKAALEKFEAGSPTHDMLSKFLRATEIGVAAGALEPCAYCNTSCGMTVRQCAEVRGKRKDLKQKIRHIDECVIASNEEQLRVLKSRRVRSADWELPSLERQISDTEKEISRLERVLGRLYDAYAEWPNPRTAVTGGQQNNTRDAGGD
ncbi:uncharacterized protein CcaverHIS019_0311270 [Cutaneotrichosporon cavernicola]|uniref:Helicase C-terminal domain-containing protein n=1 Tax=Cutaneotrichosporon cavernicola TaxID=279322 RepID=A0AA48L332_9TREE|nr:uncharacterized protein CcaverHIS019_0311270 [Cutaneotrichosporon cavernicola]BEI91057.1 hypothetical protein CcaverHIS019_0311270 [Cutaneotrichosporon cavernicola]BEI98835.1 hypothetical protein CcaverHIS631_0311340 [Cutaneotrichosporon cavernicola]BEJ06608.1 hypothetical protein CcaverHIS641_0311300 [Cutaneotrichosporon cavernicola]